MNHPRPSMVLPVMLSLSIGGGFLFFLMLITGGFFLYVLVGTACLGFFGVVNYFLWGRSLEQETNQEAIGSDEGASKAIGEDRNAADD